MKKYIIAAVAAIAVFAMSAFAASLQVNAGTLQAGNDAISQCILAPDDHVVVTYPKTPTFESGAWVTDQIALDDDGNCTGLEFTVFVTDGTWTTSTESGTFGSSPVTVTFDDAFDAEEASDIHVVIRNAA